MACINFPGGLFPLGNGADAFNRTKQAVEIIKDALCTGCIAHLSSSVALGDYLEQGFGSVVPEICDKLTVYITDGNNEIYEAIVLDPFDPTPANRITNWLLLYTDSAIDGTITGEIRMYAGDTAPAGWLICDGSAVSRATYSTLFAAISTTYGVGDNSTTFNIPDFRAKSPMGVNNGTIPNGANGAFTTRNRASVAGSETHTLITAELAAHGHTQRYRDTTGGSNNIAVESRNNGGLTNANSTTANTGSDTPHANVQPNLVVNFIIKT